MPEAGPRLEGFDLVLRGLTPADRDEVFRQATSPGFFDHIDVPDRLRTGYTIDDAEAYIAHAIRAWDHGYPAWVIEADGFAGTIRIRPTPRGDEVGYGLVPEARGRGIATRALRLVLMWCRSEGRPLPSARTATGNDASARVLERLGYTRAGAEGGWQHWRPQANMADTAPA